MRTPPCAPPPDGRPSSTFSVPMTLIDASWTGSYDRGAHIDLRRQVEHHLGLGVARSAPPATARGCRSCAGGTGGRASTGRRRGWPTIPLERSSTTSTSWPSASSRSTRVDPMKPAPPVTSARMVALPDLKLLGVEVLVDADRATRDPQAGGHHGTGRPARRDRRCEHPRPPRRRRPSTARSTTAPAPTRAPGQQHRIAHLARPPPTTDACTEHRAHDLGIACDLGGGVHALDRGAPLPIEQVELALEVLHRGAGVDPVGVPGHGVELAGRPPSPGRPHARSRPCGPVSIRSRTLASST
jgi:hypothetical protein